ncbi:hypothetical protein CHUAL_007978 [Chamberlinius hualienensis]
MPSSCFIPGCNSGYRSCKETRHLFRVGERFLDKWKNVIPRKDRTLTKSASICSLHFDERFILKEYKHVINGKEIRLERGNWGLTDDAIPTIYPSLPAYFTKKLPKPRILSINRSDDKVCSIVRNREVPDVFPQSVPNGDVLPVMRSLEQNVSEAHSKEKYRTPTYKDNYPTAGVIIRKNEFINRQKQMLKKKEQQINSLQEEISRSKSQLSSGNIVDISNLSEKQKKTVLGMIKRANNKLKE